MNARSVIHPAAVVLALASGLGGGCGRTEPASAHVIRVWSHQGQEAENGAMRAIVRAFNKAHQADGWRVDITFFPDFQYTEKVSIAAAAGDLPDALDIDGPLVARYVAAGLLRPLDRWFDAAQRADFLRTVLEQGTIGGHLYALGAFDSAAVLYYDRAMLRRAGIEPPPDEEGWTWEAFLKACGRLRAAGIEPVALHMNDNSDEWFTYAFAPVIWSGGGSLISPDGRRVRGVLASAANVRSLRAWQELFRRQFAATDPVDPDPFGEGRVAMDWNGHWMARSHLARKGSDLGAMVLPRTGAAPVAPCGSWCWAITSRAHDASMAAAWVRWVTDARDGIEPMVRANGAIPARVSAFAAFPEYREPPYRIFRYQLDRIARPRPATRFYATLTQQFAGALRDIARGADVGTRLREAEDEIQKAIDRRLGTERLEARSADRPVPAAICRAGSPDPAIMALAGGVGSPRPTTPGCRAAPMALRLAEVSP